MGGSRAVMRDQAADPVRPVRIRQVWHVRRLWLRVHNHQGGVPGSRDPTRGGAQTSHCRWEPPEVLWHLAPQHMAAFQSASQWNFERPCDLATCRRVYLASMQEERLCVCQVWDV